MAHDSTQQNYTLAWVLSGESDTGDPIYLPKEPVPEPEQWPFIQPGVLETRQNSDFAAAQERMLAGWVWQEDESILDSDEEDEVSSSYKPSEGSETRYATDHESVNEWDNGSEACTQTSTNLTTEASIDETENVDMANLALELECRELVRDHEAGWGLHQLIIHPTLRPIHIPGRSLLEDDLLLDMQLQYEMADLEYELAICQSQYNPDKVIALMTELYELMIAMAHDLWEPGCISFYPHADSPVDLDHARESGYNESALYVIQRLPYPKAGFGGDFVIPYAPFMGYNDKGTLRRALDPWIVPLTWPGNEGIWMVLDTKLGAIKVWHNGYGPMQGTPEFRRATHIAPNHAVYDGVDPLCDHRCASCIPAALYLRNLIDAYKDLRIVPNMDSSHLDGSVDLCNWNSLPIDTFSRDRDIKRRYRQHKIKELYINCGWPENFDKKVFREDLEILRAELRKPNWTIPDDAEGDIFFKPAPIDQWYDEL